MALSMEGGENWLSLSTFFGEVLMEEISMLALVGHDFLWVLCCSSPLSTWSFPQCWIMYGVLQQPIQVQAQWGSCDQLCMPLDGIWGQIPLSAISFSLFDDNSARESCSLPKLILWAWNGRKMKKLKFLTIRGEKGDSPLCICIEKLRHLNWNQLFSYVPTWPMQNIEVWYLLPKSIKR